MLGWHISVYRTTYGGATPPVVPYVQGEKLAVWQSSGNGLHWIRDLVRHGRAIELLSDGYPNLFTARAEDVLPVILNGPPDAHDTWLAGPLDILTTAWQGKTAVDHEAITRLGPQEWLLVEAWDES